MSLYHSLKQHFKTHHNLDGYTPQFRLEGRARNANDTDGLAMRTADPLWMLGRQWQFGEFKGEDNGSPINVQVRYRRKKVEYYNAVGGERREKLNNIPLEAKVEAFDIFPNAVPDDIKSKVRIGQQFERLIRKKFPKSEYQYRAARFIEALREVFTLTNSRWEQHQLTSVSGLDDQSERFFKLMKGKVIDGGLLIENLTKNNKRNKYPKASGNDTRFAPLKSVSTALLEWYENLFVSKAEGDSSWNDRQLIHQFEVHHKATVQNTDFSLSAPDYRSGDLDWYSFDKATLGNIAQTWETTEGVMPANVTFDSMPDKRLFSFEDSKIDLSMMDVEAADLLKMMLLDFSLVSGSDWYTVPVEVNLGELCWIKEVEVKDVFGVHTTIRNDGTKGPVLSENPLQTWDVFKIRNKYLTEYDEQEHFLFLPPVSSMRMESEPLEEVLFLRDEYANMVWALERKIRNGMGNPVDGHDLHQELYGPFASPEDSDADNDLPKYRLASVVPTNWIPYLPQHIDNDIHNVERCRAFMMRNEAAEAPEDIRPLTFLAEQDLVKVREEAVPSEGVRVQVTNQRVRWTDGKTYLWRGRKVLTGRGEGSSGLRFDYLREV